MEEMTVEDARRLWPSVEKLMAENIVGGADPLRMEAKKRFGAAYGSHLVRVALEVCFVLAKIPMCEECDGRGEVLDAPNNVLDGEPYWTPCPRCGGKP